MDLKRNDRNKLTYKVSKRQTQENELTISKGKDGGRDREFGADMPLL